MKNLDLNTIPTDLSGFDGDNEYSNFSWREFFGFGKKHNNEGRGAATESSHSEKKKADSQSSSGHKFNNDRNGIIASINNVFMPKWVENHKSQGNTQISSRHLKDMLKDLSLEDLKVLRHWYFEPNGGAIHQGSDFEKVMKKYPNVNYKEISENKFDR